MPYRTTLSTTALLLLPLAATAAIVDDFNDGNDDGWSRDEPLDFVGDGGTFTFPNGAYRIEAAASPAPGQVGPARAGSLRTEETFSDFDISVDLVDLASSPLDTDLGLLARVTDRGLGTTDGYGFLYDLGGILSLVRIDDEMDSPITAVPLTLTPAKSYRLRLTGEGGNFTGTVTDLSAPGAPVATITGTDSAYTSGAVGVLVYDDSTSGDQMAAGTFDNFMASVPEPSAIAYAGFSALLFGRCRRGRR